MPIYKVSMVKTVTLVWRVKAKDKKAAQARLQFSNAQTARDSLLLEVLEDDCESHIEVEELEA